MLRLAGIVLSVLPGRIARSSGRCSIVIAVSGERNRLSAIEAVS